MDNGTIRIEVYTLPCTDSQDVYSVTVLCDDFNLFDVSAKAECYLANTLKNKLINAEYKPTPSFLTVYINKYDYSLQRKFEIELRRVICKASGAQRCLFTSPFPKPPDGYYGDELDYWQRIRREKECIKRIFRRKTFDKAYDFNDYEDGIGVTINASIVTNSSIIDNIMVYRQELTILANCDDKISVYRYDGDINAPYQEDLLSGGN